VRDEEVGEMLKCEICNREFKNQQGLTGHLRLKHGIQPATTGSTEPLGIPAIPGEIQSESESAIAQVLERMDDGISELLKLPAQTLAALQSAMAELQQPEHLHGIIDSNCQDCRSEINKIGRAAQDVIRGIPGVPEAIAFAKAMSDRGKDYGWNQVPDVAAAIDQHLMDTRQIDPEEWLKALGIAVERVTSKSG